MMQFVMHPPGYFRGNYKIFSGVNFALARGGNARRIFHSTHIAVKGNEYYNIFPVWNWARIPV